MTNPICGPRDRFANLEGVVGETFYGEIIMYNGDGVTPVNLSGYTVTFKIWKGAVLTASKACELVPSDGVIKISMSAAEMLALEPVSYHFELWADNGEGQVKLVLWGWFWLNGGCLS